MTTDQLAYLEALGVPVWARKELVDGQDRAAADHGQFPAGVRLGPGSGQFLLLCSGATETAGRLASDIARAMGGQPVWAWPVDGEPGQPVAEAVGEHLFTTLLVFGSGVGRRVFGAAAPGSVGSARVLVAPGMDELAGDPAARRSLWHMLCSKNLVQGP